MTQRQALTVMLSGASVFLTGPPGAGKTYVLNEFIRRSELAGKQVAVTASTGIAATHIGGTTIHSWSGLGIRESLTAYDRDWLQANDRLRQRYASTDILVIDEVSMLHGRRLDMVNEACKLLLDSQMPFGGLQLVLVGDLFQLPPVNRENEVADFVHTSAAWDELDPKICYLSEQHRQSDDRLVGLLEAMRRGDVNEWHTEALQERLGKRPGEGVSVTRLHAHNIDVDTINERYLESLPGKSKVFVMDTRGDRSKAEQLVRGVLAPERLELKVGAEVMFVANNFSEGFVNGSRGRVTGFQEGLPQVALESSGRSVRVAPHTWSLSEDGKKRAEMVQLPLRLAWAITIHKSQGMSLDAAEIDLGKSFTPGMGYVALSRVRTLDGIYLTGINAMALRLHPDIFAFDERLRSASADLAQEVVVDDDVGVFSADLPQAVVANGALLTDLKKWRSHRAQRDGVPLYIVAHNSLVEAISVRVPITAQQLLAVPGFGPRKLEAYGEELLAILATYASPTSMPRSQPVEVAGIVSVLDGSIAIESNSWSAGEDTQLLNLFRQGVRLDEVCRTLGRQPDDIWARIVVLRQYITNS